MEEIKVINNNTFTLRGRYDGRDYVFKPGVATVLSLDAAKHIFDLGKDDKSQCLNMLGLLTPGKDTYDDAVVKYDRIAFMTGRTVFEDEEGAEPAAQEPGDAPTSQVPVGSRGQPRKVAGPSNL